MDSLRMHVRTTLNGQVIQDVSQGGYARMHKRMFGGFHY